MIKAKVIVPFYEAKDKELYLDEERFKELKEAGKVEEVKNTKKQASTENNIENATINKK